MMKKWLTLAFFSIAACGSITATEQVRIMAANQLRCDSDKVQTTQVDANTVRVHACGQDATYVKQCTGSDTTHCPWSASNVPTTAGSPDQPNQ